MHQIIEHRTDDAAMVEVLLGEGVDPNSLNREGVSGVYMAAYTAQPKIAAALIAAGANVNFADANGFTPLMMSAEGQYLAFTEKQRAFEARRTEVARLLLAAKADMNAETAEGWTALLFALDKPELLAVLIEAGAPINARTGTGWTPLTLAAADKYNNYRQAIPALLRAGADLKRTNKSGHTPEYLARENKQGKALALLEGAPLPEK